MPKEEGGEGEDEGSFWGYSIKNKKLNLLWVKESPTKGAVACLGMCLLWTNLSFENKLKT